MDAPVCRINREASDLSDAGQLDHLRFEEMLTELKAITPHDQPKVWIGLLWEKAPEGYEIDE